MAAASFTTAMASLLHSVVTSPGRLIHACHTRAAVPLRRARLTVLLGLLTLIASPVPGQGQDPKRSFADALGRLTAALEGRFGDDGIRAAAAMAALDQALAAWDQALASTLASATAELPAASAQDRLRRHVALALALAERGRVEDALQQIGAAIAIAPGDVDAHTVLGLVHSQITSNSQAATSAFRAALAADPAAPLQRYLLVKQLADHGALEEAATVGLALRIDARDPNAPDRAPFLRIPLIPEVPRVEPYFAIGHYANALALLARGQYRAGVDGLRTDAASDAFLAPPKTATEDLSRAGEALRDGDPAAALAALDRAEMSGPPWSGLYRLRGFALLADERPDEGIAAFREAVRLTPDDERSHLALAEALADQERYDEADAAIGAAIAALPPSARLHHARARVLQRKGLYPEALVEFDRSLTIQPSLPLLGKNSVYNTMATLARAQQQFAEATRAFAARANLVPNDVDAHRDLGDIYFRQSLDDLAWNEFAVAEALAPRDVATQASLAQLHLRAGRNAQAASVARRILALDPRHVQAHFVLGTSLVRMDQTEEGGRELDVFARLEADEAAARSLQLELAGLRREAEVSAGRGDRDGAVALLRQVVEKDPKSADARVALGVALVAAGRAADAVDALQQAAGLGAYGEVYRHLAEAYAALGQADQSARAREVYARIRRDELRGAARQ